MAFIRTAGNRSQAGKLCETETKQVLMQTDTKSATNRQMDRHTDHGHMIPMCQASDTRSMMDKAEMTPMCQSR